MDSLATQSSAQPTFLERVCAKWGCVVAQSTRAVLLCFGIAAVLLAVSAALLWAHDAQLDTTVDALHIRGNVVANREGAFLAARRSLKAHGTIQDGRDISARVVRSQDEKHGDDKEEEEMSRSFLESFDWVLDNDNDDDDDDDDDEDDAKSIQKRLLKTDHNYDLHVLLRAKKDGDNILSEPYLTHVCRYERSE